MFFQHWDDEIARTAQRWAENCVIDHDDGYKRYAFGKDINVDKKNERKY